jgi:hypothetical protein
LRKCRVCKKDLIEDYGIYENAEGEKRYYCFTHWHQYYYPFTTAELNTKKIRRKL